MLLFFQTGSGKVLTLKSGSNIAVWEFRKRGERSGVRLRETASRFPLSIYPAHTHFRATHMFYLVIASPSGTVTLVCKAVRIGRRMTYRLE